MVYSSSGDCVILGYPGFPASLTTAFLRHAHSWCLRWHSCRYSSWFKHEKVV